MSKGFSFLRKTGIIKKQKKSGIIIVTHDRILLDEIDMVYRTQGGTIKEE